MAQLTYVISIRHKDKGLGFTAKTALQNAQRQTVSPIKQAKFFGQPTGSHSQIEVVVDDAILCDTLTKIITSSGRMPNQDGMYTIEEVKLESKEGPLQQEVENLKRQQGSSQREITLLREEIGTLRQNVAQSKIKVNTPLEGLLGYFETVHYSPESILEEPADMDFTRRVLRGNIENTLVNYINHILGRKTSKKEVDAILAFKQGTPDELNDVLEKYQTAKEELEFLEKLKTGNTDIPETLRKEYITVIENKGHQKTIEEYESKVQKQKETLAKQEQLRELREKYNSFSDKIDLVMQAGTGIPVLFNTNEKRIEIYFPFRVREVKVGFREELGREIKGYFKDSMVNVLDHTFVAYQVDSSNREETDHLMEDVPVILRIAGFTTIIPYRLG